MWKVSLKRFVMKKLTWGVALLVVAGAWSAQFEDHRAWAGSTSGTGTTGPSEPAGIGEKGTGQMQGTMERQQSRSQGVTSEPAGIGEQGTGQTEPTAERSPSPSQKSMGAGGAGSEPAGIGEKGTGQTKSARER
jgi:hypothetical protein